MCRLWKLIAGPVPTCIIFPSTVPSRTNAILVEYRSKAVRLRLPDISIWASPATSLPDALPFKCVASSSVISACIWNKADLTITWAATSTSYVVSLVGLMLATPGMQGPTFSGFRMNSRANSIGARTVNSSEIRKLCVPMPHPPVAPDRPTAAGPENSRRRAHAGRRGSSPSDVGPAAWLNVTACGRYSGDTLRTLRPGYAIAAGTLRGEERSR